MKTDKVKPFTIHVINHAYGVDKDYDITDMATAYFEELVYELHRCSHGVVTYKQETFVRVNEIPDLNNRGDYYKLYHYLDWNKGVSVADRVHAGFKGEFWLYGNSDCKFVDYFRYRGTINSMGFNLDEPLEKAFEVFIRKLRRGVTTSQWVYTDNPRKWLARLPEKYWLKLL